MDRVKGKVVIITGGAGDLGSAAALLLAKEGAKVVVTDIDDPRGKKVVEEIRRAGGEVVYLRHDVTSEENWKTVIDRTVAEFGRLDVLVNNAGVFSRKFVGDISLEEWRWVMGINLDGVFLGTKVAIGAMKKSGGGSIINISSVAGLVGMVADTSPYGASKGAVRLFTKQCAIQLSKAGHDYNIRVNSVHPGFILTPMLEKVFRTEVESTGRSYEEVRRSREEWAPLGRLGTPEDVAYGILYLASDESKYMTGAELVIDGGFTAR
jgi:NAD(P)-dependent dehydrogenase (short-subunit alcohol dehydrogenase family)